MTKENLFDFFFLLLKEETKDYHKLSSDEHLYLSSLLKENIDPVNYFQTQEEKLVKPTLAFLLKDAKEEMNAGARSLKYKKLGDVALYTVGVMPLSLQRSLVGVDYYRDMGSLAYEQVYAIQDEKLYKKMSQNFENLIDLLNLSLALKINPTYTVVDLLNMWSITKSKGLKQVLVKMGLNPV